MLMNDVKRYISLRRTLGYKLRDTERNLSSFAVFAAQRGDQYVCVQSAILWASQAPAPHPRYRRFRDLRHFANFLHGEDSRHELMVGDPFPSHWRRPLPHIYSPAEIEQIVEAASRLHPTYSLRPLVFSTLFGLLAVTGLRVSEALALKLSDVHPDGHLVVRMTKFRKSRSIPLHPTTFNALKVYLEKRRRVLAPKKHLFISIAGGPLPYPTVQATFRTIRQTVGLADIPGRKPRIHDLRHTFATRALLQCSHKSEAVSRHMLALSTYLGHACIAHTYWYLEATPELMTGVAECAEAFIQEERP